MRIVFIATGRFALPTLDALHAAACEIPLVITPPDRPRGRGRRLTPTAVNTAATALGLEVLTAPNINDPQVIQRVRACNADVGLVIDFGQKIGPESRNACRGGCINLHASLLPKYRGAAPFQWALIRGESVTGVTVFKLTDRMDAGAILAMREAAIGPAETADELHDRLADIGPAAVADALRAFENRRVPAGRPQDETQATSAPKLRKQDAHIGFSDTAQTLVNRIHGLWSRPGASCLFRAADGSRDEIVTIARAAVVEPTHADLEPGTLDEYLHVATSDRSVKILEIKPQSGKLMTWAAYVNGRRPTPGDRFHPIA